MHHNVSLGRLTCFQKYKYTQLSLCCFYLYLSEVKKCWSYALNDAEEMTRIKWFCFIRVLTLKDAKENALLMLSTWLSSSPTTPVWLLPILQLFEEDPLTA